MRTKELFEAYGVEKIPRDASKRVCCTTCLQSRVLYTDQRFPMTLREIDEMDLSRIWCRFHAIEEFKVRF